MLRVTLLAPDLPLADAVVSNLLDIRRSGPLVRGRVDPADVDALYELSIRWLSIIDEDESLPDEFNAPVAQGRIPPFVVAADEAGVFERAIDIAGGVTAERGRWVTALWTPLVLPDEASRLGQLRLRFAESLGADIHVMVGSDPDSVETALESLPELVRRTRPVRAEDKLAFLVQNRADSVRQDAVAVYLANPLATDEAQSRFGDALRGMRMPTPQLAIGEFFPEVAPLVALLSDPAVAMLSPVGRGHRTNDIARSLVHSPPVGPPQVGLDGHGQTVALADSGADATHLDLQGQIAAMTWFGSRTTADDDSGHGTHLAGTIAGSGSMGHAGSEGIAPRAQLHVQAIAESELPLELSGVLEAAHNAGARLHNHSWSEGGEPGVTGATAFIIDHFMHHYPSDLVICAAGNEARGDLGEPTLVEAESVTSPGTAKNCLTVGSSMSARATQLTWSRSPGVAHPLAIEPVAGDADRLAPTSGRGPCSPKPRVKPDVVAPGTMISSAWPAGRAIGPADPVAWAPDVTSTPHAYSGGTSCAAAVASGCAAIVRQHYLDVEEHEPSAALVKATLINGTAWLSDAYAATGQGGPPNMQQGFGRVDLRRSLAAHHVSASLLWNDEIELCSNGATRCTFTIKTGVVDELRIAMAWTEPGTPGLDRPVSLSLVDAGGTRRWFSNDELLQKGVRRRFVDRVNNVHVIRVEDPTPGDYRLDITPIWPAQDPFQATGEASQIQVYALVVTGNIAGPLETNHDCHR